MRIRIIVFLVCVLSSHAASALKTCPRTGPETSVDEVRIVFTDCKNYPAEPFVRWFTAEGAPQGSFKIKTGVVQKRAGPQHLFIPNEVRMTTAAARGCIQGEYEEHEDRRCYATFNFPCAAKTYGLKVNTDTQVAYAVTRYIPAPQGQKPCAETYLSAPEPPEPPAFSDTEQIEIKVTTAPVKRPLGTWKCDPQKPGAKCERVPEGPSSIAGRADPLKDPAPNLETLKYLSRQAPSKIDVTLEPLGKK
jgi:hypothetical protein